MDIPEKLLVQLSPIELAADDGYEEVISVLDAVYLKYETACAFRVVKSFVEFFREGEQFLKVFD